MRHLTATTAILVPVGGVKAMEYAPRVMSPHSAAASGP